MHNTRKSSVTPKIDFTFFRIVDICRSVVKSQGTPSHRTPKTFRHATLKRAPFGSKSRLHCRTEAMGVCKNIVSHGLAPRSDTSVTHRWSSDATLPFLRAWLLTSSPLCKIYKWCSTLHSETGVKHEHSPMETLPPRVPKLKPAAVYQKEQRDSEYRHIANSWFGRIACIVIDLCGCHVGFRCFAQNARAKVFNFELLHGRTTTVIFKQSMSVLNGPVSHSSIGQDTLCRHQFTSETWKMQLRFCTTNV